MSNIGSWHKHKDHQRGNWSVFDSSGYYSCSFDYDWEAQGYCNKKNEEEERNAECE